MLSLDGDGGGKEFVIIGVNLTDHAGIDFFSGCCRLLDFRAAVECGRPLFDGLDVCCPGVVAASPACPAERYSVPFGVD